MSGRMNTSTGTVDLEYCPERGPFGLLVELDKPFFLGRMFVSCHVIPFSV